MIKEEDENEDEDSSDRSTKKQKQTNEKEIWTFKKAPIRKRSSSQTNIHVPAKLIKEIDDSKTIKEEKQTDD